MFIACLYCASLRINRLYTVYGNYLQQNSGDYSTQIGASSQAMFSRLSE